ncbi:hypothetical protein HBI56_055870 [Parastagonospora nodorum]|uniref:Secreted protein n=1 Tax=Phaeosphaeria nodorum (strain SN15 / ATCC MYA-4574 / FGSC 10173) TaxID=321614 RepID=A0A7U2ICC9_PHANO|nr:hypothetical protein HBH56_096240 [Parastagonospora nodorum]QRD07226.1 hypothetical protein JI435_424100 [Parastagonospora nodorum SN15]KAH3930498.1 hypothetical protein HBH54_110560 [Parastagonospora nodorum]KAH3945139.1 hypothetical protein HBH53_148880 [Parastagonospora nodorum]KAH3966980.1 hypothetical protein HBH51_140270 [Parastagonospora nodorum]
MHARAFGISVVSLLRMTKILMQNATRSQCGCWYLSALAGPVSPPKPSMAFSAAHAAWGLITQVRGDGRVESAARRGMW